jgi:hypothetical protein
MIDFSSHFMCAAATSRFGTVAVLVARLYCQCCIAGAVLATLAIAATRAQRVRAVVFPRPARKNYRPSRGVPGAIFSVVLLSAFAVGR